MFDQTILLYPGNIIIAYLKTSVPNPHIKVNILGPKSLAGFIAYPQLYPKAIPILSTTNPTRNGARYPGTLAFFSSVIPRTQSNNKKVPKT